MVYIKERSEIHIWPYLIAAANGNFNPHKDTPRFSEEPQLLKHVFKDNKGKGAHFKNDTSENRNTIASSFKNYIGTDSRGKHWYATTDQNGKQAWCTVNDHGFVTSGGQNKEPKPWSDKSGLSAEQRPSQPLKKDSTHEQVNQNGLRPGYNGQNPNNPAPKLGSASGQIGGVGNEVGIIKDLFKGYNGLLETEHYFYFPFSPPSSSESSSTASSSNSSSPKPMPFTNHELQQLLRELAIGIFTHDTVPFFSLHFNGQSQMYPVIDPIYQHTLVGRVISMLDYYMKGFLNGAFYDESFLDAWKQGRSNDRASLLPHLTDLHDYCKKHLGDKTEYYTVRELLGEVAKDLKADASVEKESSILSDYTAFRSSFRIIAKQNSIKKLENMFLLDSGFDVLYSIEPDPAYEDELRRYRQQYGHDPIGYQKLEKAYQATAAPGVY